MASIVVSAPDAVSEWVQRRIESGEYSSASDYLLELIRRDQNALAPELKIDDIRRTIAESRAQGGLAPAEQVFDRIERKLRAMTE